MLPSSRNVRSYLKARAWKAALTNHLAAAQAAVLTAEGRLTGGQLAEAQRVLAVVNPYTATVRVSVKAPKAVAS